jgi:hypothetical protein
MNTPSDPNNQPTPYPYGPNDPTMAGGFSPQNPYSTQYSYQQTYPPYPPPPPPPKKWYQTNGGILLLLILFFPAGLFLMWKYAGWPKQAKWTVTGVFAFLVGINGIMNVAAGPRTANSPQPTKVVQVTPTHVVTVNNPTPTPKPTPTPTPTATPAPVLMPTPVASQPTQPPVIACNGGTVMGGSCYNTDPNGGSFVFTTPPSFCDYYTCTANFSKGTGYIVECADERWSHNGGKIRACSRNGGVIATLYQH